jgi:hypothetical protein
MLAIPIFILVIAIGVMAWRFQQRTIETWRQTAAGLNLDAEGGVMGGPVMYGHIAGHPVRVDTYTQGSGNSRTTYTRYRVGYPPLGIDLSLEREGFITAVTKFFGSQDLEVGDPAFDKTFKVKTSNPNRLLSLMTPSVRSGLMRFTAAYRDSAITDDHLRVSTRRVERNGDRIRSTLQRMVATAELLTSPSAGVSDDIVVDRQQGLLDEVAGRLRERIETTPDDVDQRIFEVETLSAAGDDMAARDRLRELEHIAPADPEVVGWRDTLDAKPPPHHGERPASATELAETLFTGADLSFETRAKFNSRYAGTEIEWQGRVKQVRETAEGTRAVVTVATVDNDLYGNTDIDVVVDNAAGGTPEAGQVVTVTGTLDTIDPLMRNLFVTDGRIR